MGNTGVDQVHMAAALIQFWQFVLAKPRDRRPGQRKVIASVIGPQLGGFMRAAAIYERAVAVKEIEDFEMILQRAAALLETFERLLGIHANCPLMAAGRPVVLTIEYGRPIFTFAAPNRCLLAGGRARRAQPGLSDRPNGTVI